MFIEKDICSGVVSAEDVTAAPIAQSDKGTRHLRARRVTTEVEAVSTATKTTPRRRKRSAIEAHESHRERNRIAAAACRQRERDRKREAVAREMALQRVNDDLHALVEHQQKEITHLRKLLVASM